MSCKHSLSQRHTAMSDPLEARRSFAGHALIYICVIGGLALLNLLTSPHYPWFIWPLLGWGIGLAKHGFAAIAAGDSAPRASAFPAEPAPQPLPDSGREWPDLES
jgi:hypothetical protein